MQIIDYRDKLVRNPSASWLRRTKTTHIVIHHTATSAYITPERIAEYHVGTRGYPAIAYHILIKADGEVLLCNDLDDVTWHAGCAAVHGTNCPYNANSYSVAVSFIGDFTTSLPTTAQLSSGKEVVSWLMNKYGPLIVIGHRQAHAANTSCPGNTYQLWMGKLTEKKETIMKNKIGAHIQLPIQEWLKTSINSLGNKVPWVTMIEPPKDNPFTETKTLGRLWIGGDNVEMEYINRGEQGAIDLYNRLRPRIMESGWVECWQVANEPYCIWPYHRETWNRFFPKMGELFHKDGQKLAGPVFGTGWPGGEADAIGVPWEEHTRNVAIELLPTFSAVDYIVSHAYGKRAGPHWTERESWTYRHRVVAPVLESSSIFVDQGGRCLGWIISEGGLDIGGGKDTDGWLGPDGPTPDQHLQQIIETNNDLQNDPRVLAYCLFTLHPSDWVSFNYDGLWQSHIQSYIENIPEQESETLFNTEAMRHLMWNAKGIAYNPEAALAKEARRRGLGSPETNEIALGEYICQGFTNAILYTRIGEWGSLSIKEEKW